MKEADFKTDERILLDEEVNRIRNRARYNPEWTKLLDRLNHFANVTRRSQSNAVFWLLEKAIDEWEKGENT
jgi:hypothetical protein